MIRRGLGAALAAATLVGSGCSIKKMAVGALASSLAESGDVFASDDDPELVRDATPFALKTTEALLVEAPTHRGLLLSACSGFAQYGYAFVQSEADRVEGTDPARATELRARALRLYLRAREYGLRGLEVGRPGLRDALLKDPGAAVASTRKDEVSLLYWTAAAWGAAISVGKDRPDLLADSSVVRAMVERALALDETFDRGAIWELMISIEGLPAAMGGSPARARSAFEKAVAMSGGGRASTYLALAEAVSIPAQDRAEFDRLIDAALAIDPDREPASRLANLVAQRRARLLRERVADLFLEETP